jgi:hypothetical protein
MPIRLQKQLEENSIQGHKLQNLLEKYQYALCKEPRDHIYGFVGLATDCVGGFPIDYRKSLFEVWKDTIMFKNADRSASSQHDIMKFGRLIQRLLGGPAIATANEISRDIASGMAHPGRGDRGVILHGTNNVRYNNLSELLIPGRLLGRIEFFGPTFKDIMSIVDKTTEWKIILNRHISKAHLDEAREESDLFIEAMEKAGNEDLNMITSFNHDISQKPIVVRSNLLAAGMVSESKAKRSGKAQNILQTSSAMVRPSSMQQRLFLLGLSRVHADSPGRMGLAPPNACVGDYVIQIHGVERALVLRNDNNGSTRLVGTAVLAENCERARATKEKRRKTSPTFGISNFAFRRDETVELSMDAAVAYQLLLG